MTDKTICANCHHSYGQLHSCKCKLRLSGSGENVKTMFRKQQMLGFRFAVMHFSGEQMTDDQIGEIMDSQNKEIRDTFDRIANS